MEAASRKRRGFFPSPDIAYRRAGEHLREAPARAGRDALRQRIGGKEPALGDLAIVVRRAGPPGVSAIERDVIVLEERVGVKADEAERLRLNAASSASSRSAAARAVSPWSTPPPGRCQPSA
jgi:hypothetical protein